MLRLLCWWLLPAVLLVGTAGCGSENKEPPPPENKDSAKPPPPPKDVKRVAP
jgi:hypothetical protein